MIQDRRAIQKEASALVLLPYSKERYRLLALIGKGGFGAVYKAEDTILACCLVAVKEMTSGPEDQSSSLKMVFEREAFLLARLMHAQLPRIYDYFTAQKRYYLVMDYIEGLTLEQHAKQAPGGRLPLVQVLGYGIQLCDVLEYLHSRKPHPIVFRDLKPSNIIVPMEIEFPWASLTLNAMTLRVEMAVVRASDFLSDKLLAPQPPTKFVVEKL